MNKKIIMFVYDSFAEFEIAVLLTALRATPHTLTTVSVSPDPVTTTGGLRVVADRTVADVDPAEVDAMVIPGGDPAPLLGDAGLAELIRAVHRRGSLLAAICGGPALLGSAGVLDDARWTASLTREDAAHVGVAGRGTQVAQPLVVDRNLVTASGSNYLGFAEEVLRHLDGVDTASPLTYFREVSLD
ncbi:DJ-1/PfpI family protein [Micromonospora sp. NPDC005806]|uniref:DJ-1/PfpI family protein n=1 Tax=Micromonospora sp. NPDC005806 TaxID=3364234 RepID=UPI00369D3D6C